jgi:hypothetical protein
VYETGEDLWLKASWAASHSRAPETNKLDGGDVLLDVVENKIFYIQTNPADFSGKDAIFLGVYRQESRTLMP